MKKEIYERDNRKKTVTYPALCDFLCVFFMKRVGLVRTYFYSLYNLGQQYLLKIKEFIFLLDIISLKISFLSILIQWPLGDAEIY
jgi:hypothetical protein